MVRRTPQRPHNGRHNGRIQTHLGRQIGDEGEGGNDPSDVESVEGNNTDYDIIPEINRLTHDFKIDDDYDGLGEGGNMETIVDEDYLDDENLAINADKKPQKPLEKQANDLREGIITIGNEDDALYGLNEQDQLKAQETDVGDDDSEGDNVKTIE